LETPSDAFQNLTSSHCSIAFQISDHLPDNQRFITELPLRESRSGLTGGFTIWKADAASLTRQKDLRTTEPGRLTQLSHDGQSLIWANKRPVMGDITAWKPLPLGKPANDISSLLILADGRLVAVDDKGKWTLWDADLKSVQSTFTHPAPNRFTRPPTDIHGQVSENDILVSNLVINVSSGKVVRQLKKYYYLLWNGICGGVKNKRFAGVGTSGRIQVWNLQTGARIFEIETNEVGVTAAIAADASLMASVSHHANLQLWDLGKGRRTALWREAPQDRTVERELADGDGYDLTAVAISPDGKKIMIGESSGRVFIFLHERSKLKRLR
jgi:WD40 repeat protein